MTEAEARAATWIRGAVRDLLLTDTAPADAGRLVGRCLKDTTEETLGNAGEGGAFLEALQAELAEVDG